LALHLRSLRRKSGSVGGVLFLMVSGRKVIVYELNEVPWEIVDRFVSKRPQSALAGLLRDGDTMTTVVDDLVPLQPWRTWPTFHKSLNPVEHKSFDLGQDPRTFHGPAIWDVVEEAGGSVGLWGPLQSWPAREFKHGSFYFPDTFSIDAKTFPTSLSRFQAFNLKATQENGFSSDAPVKPADVIGVGVDLARQGLTLRTTATMVQQLIKERRDRRYKGRRSLMQAPLNFDLYWKLQRKYRPDLSIFFTNHVAGMMHRFWGDAIAGYAEQEGYPADPVFGEFIDSGMELADQQLAKIRRYVEAHPDTFLLVAASMGQGPVPYERLGGVFVVEQPDRLASVLGLPKIKANLAMYPHVALQLPEIDDALPAAQALATVRRGNGAPLFGDLRLLGSVVSFQVDNYGGAQEGETAMTVGPLADGRDTHSLTLEELGIAVQPRLGGSNTAYHVPEGMAVAFGTGVKADQGRRKVDILDVTPSLLSDVLGLEPAASMKGKPGLFA
jgi:hypothetical protein